MLYCISYKSRFTVPDINDTDAYASGIGRCDASWEVFVPEDRPTSGNAIGRVQPAASSFLRASPGIRDSDPAPAREKSGRGKLDAGKCLRDTQSTHGI